MSGSRAVVVYFMPDKLAEIDGKARGQQMSRNEYVRWCVQNAGQGSGLAQIVEKMTIEELSQMTGISVTEIITWAMTPEPEPKPNLTVVKTAPVPFVPKAKSKKKSKSKKTAKETAKQKDDKVLQEKLKD